MSHKGDDACTELTPLKEACHSKVVLLVGEENTDPFEKWKSQRTKILFLVAVPALFSAITSTMYLPSINEVIRDLNTTEELVALTLSCYSLAIGILTMVWGPICDRYGRRIVLLTSFFIFMLSSVLAGIAWNVYWLILARVLQAAGLSAASIIGSGSISDVYPPEIRGHAIGMYTATQTTGAIIGPTLGGIVASILGWRAIFWSLSCAAVPFIISIFFLLPETLNKVGRPTSASPLQSLPLLVYPPITIVCLAGAAMSGAILLILFIFPLQMNSLYNLSELEMGFCFLPFGIGNLFGTYVGGRTADRCAAWKGPGGRLIPSSTGILLVTLTVVAYGWLWDWNFWVSLLFTFMVGFLLTFTRPGLITFAIERQPRRPASVQAASLTFSSWWSFLTLSFAPLILEHFSVAWVLSCYCIIFLIVFTLLVVLMIKL